MSQGWHKNAWRVGVWTITIGVLSAVLVGMSGCVVRVGPPPRYYYRTRVVYTWHGPVYVRERVYYEPGYEPAPGYEAEPVYAGPPPAVAESPAAAQLHPLVAPIALYPDPLIAVVLPASTYPQQVQDANAWLASNPRPPQDAIDAQPWDPSVKALVHYPTALAKLAGDMQWTQSLGSAYLNQPSDVMAAIQQMRAQAVAEGNLIDTPQQVLIQDGGAIAIEPANPDVIYVPTYDPVVVYTRYDPIYFAPVAFVTGPWLINGCYWGGGVIFVGDWHGGYRYHDGYWRRDYAWHVDRDRYWARDRRFGPPPRIDRFHYAMAPGVRGREAEIHQSMTRHAEQRRAVEQRARADHGPRGNDNRSNRGRGSREQDRR